MDTEARLIDIETRLAFQDQTLGELSELIHRQRQELDALRRSLAQANSDLMALRDSFNTGPAHEPPPHY